MPTKVPVLRPFEEVAEAEAEAAGAEEGEGLVTTPEGTWMLLLSVSVARGQAARVDSLLYWSISWYAARSESRGSGRCGDRVTQPTSAERSICGLTDWTSRRGGRMRDVAPE